MEFPFIAKVSKIPYDIILGRDILKALNIDILYSEDDHHDLVGQSNKRWRCGY